MTAKHLRRVAACAAAMAAAEQAWREAIIEARIEGHETYQDIADAAGITRQGVWKIVNAQPK